MNNLIRRRSFLTGLVAAPAVILTPGLLMPVQSWFAPLKWELIWRDGNGQIVHRKPCDYEDLINKPIDYTFVAKSTSMYTPEVLKDGMLMVSRLHEPVPVATGMTVRIEGSGHHSLQKLLRMT